ncbi:MAG: hypothetical protein JNN15_03165 [Blastocatellia bacterium]|nr:hypothetical protein [Blastocatellia bacterium]
MKDRLGKNISNLDTGSVENLPSSVKKDLRATKIQTAPISSFNQGQGRTGEMGNKTQEIFSELDRPEDNRTGDLYAKTTSDLDQKVGVHPAVEVAAPPILQRPLQREPAREPVVETFQPPRVEEPRSPTPQPEVYAPAQPQPVVNPVVEKRAVLEKTAATEAVSIPVQPKYYEYHEPQPSPKQEPPSNEKAKFAFGSFESYVEGGDIQSEPDSPRSAIRSAMIYIIPVLILLATVALLFIYIPNLRNKIPPRIAALVGIEIENTEPQVSLEEYRLSTDNTDKMTTITGIVKNLTKEPIKSLQVEITLYKKEDVRITEKKLVALEPEQLGVNEEGKYLLKVPAADYQQMKVSGIFGEGKNLKLKRLGIVDPEEININQLPPRTIQLKQPKPKVNPDQIYEESITFK